MKCPLLLLQLLEVYSECSPRPPTLCVWFTQRPFEVDIKMTILQLRKLSLGDLPKPVPHGARRERLPRVCMLRCLAGLQLKGHRACPGSSSRPPWVCLLLVPGFSTCQLLVAILWVATSLV